MNVIGILYLHSFLNTHSEMRVTCLDGVSIFEELNEEML